MSIEALARLAAVALMAMSLWLAHRAWGFRLVNLPLWSGCGMTLFYAAYAGTGLHFGNGVSPGAEILVAIFMLVGTLAFNMGATFAGRPVGRHTRHERTRAMRIPSIPPAFVVLTLTVLMTLFIVLTDGRPWAVVTEGVELKWVRLAAATDKDPFLLNLDAIALALVLLGLGWTILAVQDSRPSMRPVALFGVLVLLYVLSTGSRTPLLAVVTQAIPAIAVARRRSIAIDALARRWRLLIPAGVLAIAYMVVTTGSRIEFEELDATVFQLYFDIDDLGITERLFQTGGAFGFFLSTAIIYAASTFNNLVIRLQDIGEIDPSYGYRFLFFYISALRILLGGLASSSIDSWRDLGTRNNEHLLSRSQSATQWATPYGDIVWDFGILGTFISVVVWSLAVGWLMATWSRRPTFGMTLISVSVVGFSLLPLVNPLLSLHVHYLMLFSLAALALTARRRRRRSGPRRSPAAGAGNVTAKGV